MHKQINIIEVAFNHMKCVDSQLKYIGQTGRTLNITYKEHVHAIRNSSRDSEYILTTHRTQGT
jgi:hypothetical protein